MQRVRSQDVQRRPHMCNVMCCFQRNGVELWVLRVADTGQGKIKTQRGVAGIRERLTKMRVINIARILLLLDGVLAHTGVAHIGDYPGSTTSTTKARGTLVLDHIAGTDMLEIKGVLTGLEPSSSGGWHIHTGCKCTVAADEDASMVVGGHYYPDMLIDPWIKVKYTANAKVRSARPLASHVARFVRCHAPKA